MGWRFRRSIQICKGVHLNFSKSGMGISVGGRGFHMGTGPRGSYVSGGIPGTGIYGIEYLKKRQKAPHNSTSTTQTPQQATHHFDLPQELKDKRSSVGCLLFPISLIALMIFWPVGLVLLISDIIWTFARPKTPEDQARGLYFQGQRALEENNRAGALELFKKAVEIKPEVPVLWLKIADLEREQGNLAEAEKAYEKALEHGKYDPEACFHYAWTLMNENKPEKAIEILQDLPAEARQELPVINVLATCFLGTDRPQAALEVLQQGPVRKRSMDDQMVLYHYIFGVAYKELGDKRKAAAHLNKVIAVDEGYLDAKELLEQLNAPTSGQ